MRKLILPALAATTLAAPLPAFAQESDAPITLEEQREDLSGMADRLKDPERQRQMALMLRTMSEVLLDLPLAPLMDAMGEVSADLTGEEAPQVDPDATLRSIAPQAERIPEQVEKTLPRALDAMGSMAEAFGAMAPALRDMAARMKDAELPAE